MLNLRRASAFTMVLIIHVALLIVSVFESRSRYIRSLDRGFSSTWVVLPSEPAPRKSRDLAPKQIVLPQIISIQVETPEIEHLPIPPEDTGKAVDWRIEAHQSVIVIPEESKTREFGHFPGKDSLQEPQHSETIHRAGESYRDSSGNNVVWMNDNCYVVSEAVPLGGPDVFARMAPTRAVCVDRSAPEGELFKDLSAYKKYHPQ